MASFIQEVVAIIDRSGSMSGKEADTVGGINSTLSIIRQDLKPGERVNVSIKLFDHEERLLIRSLNIEDVRPLELRQFVPRGQTALYDAIGSSLTYFMEKKLHDPTSYTKCLIYARYPARSSHPTNCSGIAGCQSVVEVGCYHGGRRSRDCRY